MKLAELELRDRGLGYADAVRYPGSPIGLPAVMGPSRPGGGPRFTVFCPLIEMSILESIETSETAGQSCFEVNNEKQGI
jgi:hypothetical protein